MAASGAEIKTNPEEEILKLCNRVKSEEYSRQLNTLQDLQPAIIPLLKDAYTNLMAIKDTIIKADLYKDDLFNKACVAVFKILLRIPPVDVSSWGHKYFIDLELVFFNKIVNLIKKYAQLKKVECKESERFVEEFHRGISNIIAKWGRYSESKRTHEKEVHAELDKLEAEVELLLFLQQQPLYFDNDDFIPFIKAADRYGKYFANNKVMRDRFKLFLEKAISPGCLGFEPYTGLISWIDTHHTLSDANLQNVLEIMLEEFDDYEKRKHSQNFQRLDNLKTVLDVCIKASYFPKELLDSLRAEQKAKESKAPEKVIEVKEVKAPAQEHEFNLSGFAAVFGKQSDLAFQERMSFIFDKIKDPSEEQQALLQHQALQLDFKDRYRFTPEFQDYITQATITERRAFVNSMLTIGYLYDTNRVAERTLSTQLHHEIKTELQKTQRPSEHTLTVVRCIDTIVRQRFGQDIDENEVKKANADLTRLAKKDFECAGEPQYRYWGTIFGWRIAPIALGIAVLLLAPQLSFLQLDIAQAALEAMVTAAEVFAGLGTALGIGGFVAYYGVGRSQLAHNLLMWSQHQDVEKRMHPLCFDVVGRFRR